MITANVRLVEDGGITKGIGIINYHGIIKINDIRVVETTSDEYGVIMPDGVALRTKEAADEIKEAVIAAYKEAVNIH